MRIAGNYTRTGQSMQKAMRRFPLVYIVINILLVLLAFPATSYAASFPFIGTLHAGLHPEGLAVDEQTHMLYINYEYPGAIVGFDAIQGAVRWHTDLPERANDVQVDSGSHRVFASATTFDNRPGTFVILDGTNGHVLYKAPIASGDNNIAFDARRHRIYVSDETSTNIFEFDVLKGWDSGTLDVQASQVSVGMTSEGLGVNSQSGRVYIASFEGASRVKVLDEQSGHIITTIPVAQQPTPPLRVNEATGNVYVVCSAGQELDVIDGETNKVIARTPIAPNAEGLAINAATGRIYVANEGDRIMGNTLTVIDGQTFDAIGTIQVGRSPDGVEADPGLHRVYVSLENDNAVLEMSDSTEIPLTANVTSEIITAHHAISLLQQAALITFVAMLLTVVGAILGAQLPRWRVRGTPRTRPDDASTHSETSSPPR